jgi:hypothetical protein
MPGEPEQPHDSAAEKVRYVSTNIICDDRTPNELGEDGDERGGPHPVQILLVVEQYAVIPSFLAPVHLGIVVDLGLHFLELELDDGRLWVASAMVLD